MPVQFQESPRAKSFIEEERERSTSTSSKQKKFSFQKKEKKPFQMTTGKGIAIAAVCLVCLGGGAALRNTTLFLEHRTVDQYLPIEEYVMKDRDTGEYTQNIRSLHLKNEYTYDTHSSYKMTSRGIKVGDTWDDFIKAYGDLHADTIYTHRIGEDGYASYEDKDSQYFSDPMLLSEFQKNYVDTGIVDPEKDEITVVFRVYTDGIKIFYTEAELDRLYDEYYDHPFRHPFRSYPNYKSFDMDFTFRPAAYKGNERSGLEYISSYFG